MMIKMLDNVTPESYDVAGDYSWRQAVQWSKDDVCDVDDSLANRMIENGDAVEASIMDSMAKFKSSLSKLNDSLHNKELPKHIKDEI